MGCYNFEEKYSNIVKNNKNFGWRTFQAIFIVVNHITDLFFLLLLFIYVKIKVIIFILLNFYI